MARPLAVAPSDSASVTLCAAQDTQLNHMASTEPQPHPKSCRHFVPHGIVQSATWNIRADTEFIDFYLFEGV